MAKEYNIPVSIIKTWKMKIDHPDKYLGNGQKRGRPKEKELTKEDWKESPEEIMHIIETEYKNKSIFD